MERLKEINNELKDYLNEAKFISNKCRNKVLKYLIEAFDFNISVDDYKDFANVDASITEDGKLMLRGKEYNTKTKINDFSSIEEKYSTFKVQADKLLSKKDLSFDNINNVSNIINLIMIVVVSFVLLIVSVIAIMSVLSGNLSFTLWFVIFIVPAVVPGLKEDLIVRFSQAKNYIKRLIKKARKK